MKVNANILSQNRAEEFGFDLFNEFVVPPSFDSIDFERSNKPKVFIGGRGSGKTMLLRYLSHKSQFSLHREDITLKDFEHIGLNWKAETFTVFQMQKRGISIEDWTVSFEHLFTLVMTRELISCLRSIKNTSYDHFNSDEFNAIRINLEPFSLGNAISLDELDNFLKTELIKFNIWLRNVRVNDRPQHYPLMLLSNILEIFKSKIACIKNSKFDIYIDEYENLVGFQKRVVNTWVKHSQNPLFFHLAMKRNAFNERRTLSTESLSNVHDYRKYDLEETFLQKENFEVFASEVLLYRLNKEHNLDLGDFDSTIVTDPEKLSLRRDRNYISHILETTRSLFPSQTTKEMANEINNDSQLLNRLKNKLDGILKKRNSELSYNEFIYVEDLRSTIVAISLLHRTSLRVEDVLNELQKFKNNEKSKFKDWIDNNFVGSFLLFYNIPNKPCPLYSGFSTFCTMSRGNIRHLTELCYKTFLRASDRNSNDSIVDLNNIKIKHQSQAAKQAAVTFLNEIKTFGRLGNKLYTFTLRIGSLFELAQNQPKQSEPERIHFSLSKGERQSEDSTELINEALMWSVLFESKLTKSKNKNAPDVTEYLINPIYTPFFNISYRKKRRLELSMKEFNVIISGSLDEYQELINTYRRKWNIEDSNLQGDLFKK